ncbi:CYTH domain-containing protein [Fictibacillus gelatini]|uniref:CYTH domain-containing protein n=1 Tax=Fictibacillus gelatini TaxID=225985 RepID=UPI00041461BB|nr:CYTH domain-containing protein [Fictibacillus gelatini]
MKQEIEIEFKNLLTADEFFRVSNHFSLSSSSFKKQSNHYFDTPSFDLKRNRCALRIREKDHTFTLTLKQPHPDGLLETHQIVSGDELKKMKESGGMLEGEISDILQHEFQIPVSNLRYLGTLSTNRAEIGYRDGLLVLDESEYLGITDYEVEYEAKDRETGQIVFESFLKEHNIPLRPTDNKIQRFFKLKENL